MGGEHALVREYWDQIRILLEYNLINIGQFGANSSSDNSNFQQFNKCNYRQGCILENSPVSGCLECSNKDFSPWVSGPDMSVSETSFINVPRRVKKVNRRTCHSLPYKSTWRFILFTVVPANSDSDLIHCLQLLSKTLTGTLHSS